MKKLDTPLGMLLTVALLAIYAAYAFLTASAIRSWMFVLVGAVAVCACIGTAMLRPWSRYLVYVLTAGFIGNLAYSIYAGAEAGYFSFQFQTPGAAARSLVPGLVMAVLSAACCVLVYRYFSRRAATEGNPRVDSNPAR